MFYLIYALLNIFLFLFLLKVIKKINQTYLLTNLKVSPRSLIENIRTEPFRIFNRNRSVLLHLRPSSSLAAELAWLRRMAAARRRSPTASLLFLLCYSSVLLFFLRLSSSSSWSPSSRDDLSTCLAVYDEGGAPAVFESPKCPRWTLADESEGLGSSAVRRTPRCQPAVMQGRRRHLEDRAVCALDIRIPFPGKSPIVQICLIVGAVRLDYVAFEWI